MDFWNHKINVSKEAAQQQVAIINTFSSEKRMKIALDFANFGIQQTRTWIKKSNPIFSDLEVNLEFVRLMYYEKGEITDEHWKHYQKIMNKKIKKNWADRFRKMMKDNEWSYDDIARSGDFKNGKAVEANMRRSLPSFAKLAVMFHESNNKT